LIFSDPGPNSDPSHKLLWILGLMAGLLAYVGPIVVLLMSRETWLHRLVATPAFAVTLAILMNLSGAVVSLFLLVMLMAGGANSKPAQLIILKQLIWGVSVVGILGLGSGIWTLLIGRVWLSVALGAIPSLVALTIVTVSIKLSA